MKRIIPLPFGILTVIIVLVALAGALKFNLSDGDIFVADPSDPSEAIPISETVSYQCGEHQGTWLADFNECEYPDSREWCEQAGGEFQECESACRNDPEAEICTLQCVIVCQF